MAVAPLTTTWLCSKSIDVLNWSASTSGLSQTEKLWCIMKHEYNHDQIEMMYSSNPISVRNGTGYAVVSMARPQIS